MNTYNFTQKELKQAVDEQKKLIAEVSYSDGKVTAYDVRQALNSELGRIIDGQTDTNIDLAALAEIAIEMFDAISNHSRKLRLEMQHVLQDDEVTL